MEGSLARMVFALSARNRFAKSVKADVVIFSEEGIELKKGSKIERKILWLEIEQIRYTHFRKGGGMINLLGGNLFGRREAKFTIRSEGEVIELDLELDAEYRSQEIRTVLAHMYLKGVALYEYNTSGLPLFLLNQLGDQTREERIDEWVTSQEPD